VSRYEKPGWFDRYVFVPTVAAFVHAGVSVWGARILRVRGRTSGEWRSTPVNVLTLQGKRYLVSPRGETHWVRNIRARNEGELIVGRRVEPFRAVEITEDARIPILREYLRRWKFEVGQFFGGVSAESPESELRRIAPNHPVFLALPKEA
jgi:deazaflavin-dependent oxidoreductase (nitroreductase family)